MSFLTAVKEKSAEFISDNATVLLTAGGVVGTVATAVLAARGGYKYAKIETAHQMEIFDENFVENNEHDVKFDDIEIPKKVMFVAAAPHIISPVAAGGLTISAIVFSHRMSAQRAAALAAAYGLVERNFGDYKAKVEERITGPKKTEIKDELAKDAVERTSGHEQVIVIEGTVLCFDVNAGRYFNSTVERIRQAANTTNAEVISRGFAPVSFFYDELDLEGAPWADAVGFGPDNMLELDISSQLKGGKPCVIINFAKPPSTEYGDPKNY